MQQSRRFELYRRLTLAVLAALIVGFVLVGLPARVALAADEPVVYVVQPGDRLVDIAARYGVSASAIVRANKLPNSDVIFPGQKLVIPVPGTGSTPSVTPSSTPGSTPSPTSSTTPDATPVAPPSGTPGGAPESATATATPATTATATGPKYHIVQLGETLDKIARAYDVSASAIIQANGITNADLIYVGQKLLIPTGSAAGTPQPVPTQTIYVVQAGDTLSAIAKRFGTTVDKLVDINGLGSPDKLRVGMRLLVSGSGSSSQPTYPGRATRFVVDISDQRCWLYRGETVIAKWVCSTGRPGSGTRPGTYKIQSKMPKAYGSTWDIWMPYWLGIYWAGASENGIHGLPWTASTGNQIWSGYLGTPITYGCVMVDNVNAKMLYDMSYIGMPVVIRP